MKIIFDMEKITNEDDLPDCMLAEIYDAWHQLSWIDIVRVGPSVEVIE